MDVEIICPNCAAELVITRGFAYGQCPDCGQSIVVEDGVAYAEDDPEVYDAYEEQV